MDYWEPKTVSMFRTVFLKISALLALCVAVGCSGQKATAPLPYYNTPDFTPLFINNAAAQKSIDHHIADFSFMDQNGQAVTQQAIEGKVHVANFFFTSCGSICPAMMRNMLQVHKAFAQDSNVVILSYSVTPWIDSVAKLKKYAQAGGYDAPQWHLLTGSKAAIYTLARQSYFAEEDLGYSRDSTDFLHTEHFVLVDQQKRIRGIYNGTLPLEAEQLVKDIALLRKE
jgi:protein SCO1